uniref:NECAP PHear domain-containing protein n=1 Tax=Arundo donax TaxID=35708 RepID=A0A0A9CHY2_ARUDO
MASGGEQAPADAEPLELVLFQVAECYVYLIPPRKTAASYRADEWNVNKWAWEGALKVVSKGEDCIIKLEDKNTGELYARAFLREGEPHPVEPVIDSSRYFVLRVEENIDGRQRHAFIGLGFRERPEAYDFQAALHDHMKYPCVRYLKHEEHAVGAAVRQADGFPAGGSSTPRSHPKKPPHCARWPGGRPLRLCGYDAGPVATVHVPA